VEPIACCCSSSASPGRTLALAGRMGWRTVRAAHPPSAGCLRGADSGRHSAAGGHAAPVTAAWRPRMIAASRASRKGCLRPRREEHQTLIMLRPGDQAYRRSDLFGEPVIRRRDVLERRAQVRPRPPASGPYLSDSMISASDGEGLPVLDCIEQVGEVARSLSSSDRSHASMYLNIRYGLPAEVSASWWA